MFERGCNNDENQFWSMKICFDIFLPKMKKYSIVNDGIGIQNQFLLVFSLFTELVSFVRNWFRGKKNFFKKKIIVIV